MWQMILNCLFKISNAAMDLVCPLGDPFYFIGYPGMWCNWSLIIDPMDLVICQPWHVTHNNYIKQLLIYFLINIYLSILLILKCLYNLKNSNTFYTTFSYCNIYCILLDLSFPLVIFIPCSLYINNMLLKLTIECFLKS